MRRKRRPVWLLVVSLLSLASLIYLILNFPPSHKFTILDLKIASSAYNLQFTILPIFFLLTFAFCFSLFAFLLNNKRRGLFFGLFVLTILVLRLNHLLHPFFLILLLAFFITLDLLSNSRKKWISGTISAWQNFSLHRLFLMLMQNLILVTHWNISKQT